MKLSKRFTEFEKSKEYSRSFNHDLKAIFADLQKQQAESGRKVVTLSQKHSLTKRWSGRVTDIGSVQ